MKRPETFSDVIGHNWLVQYLTQHIEDGSLHHFLILEGPEGIGKTSLADIIALSLVYGINNSEQRHAAYEQVVVKGESNDNIKHEYINNCSLLQTQPGGYACRRIAVNRKPKENVTGIRRPKWLQKLQVLYR